MLYKKTNFKKVGFSTMAFTAKILSWRFRHLNIVGCLLKKRPTKGGHGHPRTPLATPLDFSFDMLHVIEQTVSGTWKLLNQERSKKGSISETRASDHRHSLNKYESRDQITEQVKRVVPRKGKGKKDKKFCIASPLT